MGSCQMWTVKWAMLGARFLRLSISGGNGNIYGKNRKNEGMGRTGTLDFLRIGFLHCFFCRELGIWAFLEARYFFSEIGICQNNT